MEVVVCRRSSISVFLKISQISQEAPAQEKVFDLLKRDSNTGEIFEIFKNTFFYRALAVATSKLTKRKVILTLAFKLIKRNLDQSAFR